MATEKNCSTDVDSQRTAMNLEIANHTRPYSYSLQESGEWPAAGGHRVFSVKA